MKNLLTIALCGGLILVVGLIVFLVVYSLGEPVPRPALPPITTTRAETREERGAGDSMVPLYFLSSDQRRLVRERRPVRLTGRFEERLETIVQEILKGPTSRNLLPTIPTGTQLQSLFWDKTEGCVVLSLSRDFLERRPGHALAEWASIYSLVNTVAVQNSAIRSVHILVDGELVEEGTLWDLSEPFAPDLTFVLYGPMEATESP